MEIIQYDINRRHTLTRVGKVNDHRLKAIQFTGFELEPDQTLYVCLLHHGKQKVIPMADTTYVIGKPLTLRAGDFKLQLEIRGGSREWDTDWFTFRIEPMEHECCCHHGQCDGSLEDPNVQKWVELMRYKLEEIDREKLSIEDFDDLFNSKELTQEQIRQVLDSFVLADGSVTYEKLSPDVQEMLNITYEQLPDKPSINDVVLVGKKSLSDLGVPTPEYATYSDIDIAIFTE